MTLRLISRNGNNGPVIGAILQLCAAPVSRDGLRSVVCDGSTTGWSSRCCRGRADIPPTPESGHEAVQQLPAAQTSPLEASYPLSPMELAAGQDSQARFRLVMWETALGKQLSWERRDQMTIR